MTDSIIVELISDCYPQFNIWPNLPTNFGTSALYVGGWYSSKFRIDVCVQNNNIHLYVLAIPYSYSDWKQEFEYDIRDPNSIAKLTDTIKYYMTK